MSAGAQIDYDKLAQQHGGQMAAGAVDYDALAQRHGGQVLRTEDTPPAGTPPDVGAEVLGGVADLAKGAGKGALSTLTGLSAPIHAIPKLGPKLIPDYTLDRLNQIKTPTNDAQNAGYIGEQAAEWLLPTGLESKAEGLAAKVPGVVGRMLKPAARIGASALESGVRNKVQGGDFKTGAEAGVLGGGASEALRAVAPSIAESALGIGKRDRGYGKTPGRAILDETRGVRPSVIETSARGVTSGLTKDIEGMAAAHTGRVDLHPALGAIDDEIAKAARQNNGPAIEQLKRVRAVLTDDVTTGLKMTPQQPATKALELKRGLRNQFVRNWNPELQADIPGVAKRASGAIDQGLDAALGPEFANKNQRISSLIPVAERAESTSRNAGILPRVAHRVAAHTGAATMGALGGVEGYRTGGLKGGIVGAGMGLVLPEVISSPTMRMIGARAINSPATTRSLTGLGLRLSDPENPERKKRREE